MEGTRRRQPVPAEDSARWPPSGARVDGPAGGGGESGSEVVAPYDGWHSRDRTLRVSDMVQDCAFGG